MSPSYKVGVYDPRPPRWNSLEDAEADLREGTRKRSIPMFELSERGLPRVTEAYRNAPIGVMVTWLGDSYEAEILERKGLTK